MDIKKTDSFRPTTNLKQSGLKLSQLSAWLFILVLLVTEAQSRIFCYFSQNEGTLMITPLQKDHKDMKVVYTDHKLSLNHSDRFIEVPFKLKGHYEAVHQVRTVLNLEPADGQLIKSKRLAVYRPNKGKLEVCTRGIYYKPVGKSWETIGMVFAIVYAALSLFFWICGAPQFYHLVKWSQLFYLISLLVTNLVPGKVYQFSKGFSFHLFSAIPNPLEISEKRNIKCLSYVQFFSQDISCSAINSMRNYYLTFLIFLAIVFLITFNKKSAKPFFVRWSKASSVFMFSISIIPYATVALFLGISTETMAFGARTSLLIVVFLSYIITYFAMRKVIQAWNNPTEFARFSRHLVFSRTNLTKYSPKLRKVAIWFLIDFWKNALLGGLIGGLHKKSYQQLGGSFVLYLVSSMYNFFGKPFPSRTQNIIHGLVDLFMTTIYIIILAGERSLKRLNPSTLENTLGTLILVLLIAAFLLNLSLFLLPILKRSNISKVAPIESSKAVDNDTAHPISLRGHSDLEKNSLKDGPELEPKLAQSPPRTPQGEMNEHTVTPNKRPPKLAPITGYLLSDEPVFEGRGGRKLTQHCMEERHGQELPQPHRDIEEEMQRAFDEKKKRQEAADRLKKENNF